MRNRERLAGAYVRMCVAACIWRSEVSCMYLSWNVVDQATSVPASCNLTLGYRDRHGLPQSTNHIVVVPMLVKGIAT